MKRIDPEKFEKVVEDQLEEKEVLEGGYFVALIGKEDDPEDVKALFVPIKGSSKQLANFLSNYVSDQMEGKIFE